MIHIGKTNNLTIIRDTPVGMYLGENEAQVVLLPKKYIKPEFKVGDQVDVFIYKDSEDRLVATTLEPYAEVNQFAHLNVSEVSRVGAFLDWGLEKDLFVPFKEQKKRMEEGSSYVVFVYLDEVTQRVVASSKINKFISNEVLTVEVGQEVDLLVYDRSPMGYNCIINGDHKGLLYNNEIYSNIQVGDQLTGYIKTIRENNLIDLSLQKLGFKNVLSSTDIILDYLHRHEGFVALSDKSSPEEILKVFSMSKATFKKSIGVLYRQRKVRIGDDGVHLLKESIEAQGD
ncbi:MAG: GntR family transcriptional regulator [Bacteroidetes bacterium]|nr:GntR family transcriptional regulator [Bacteroidota bacterium]